MSRRPLLVGALVALVGVASIILLGQRDADGTPAASAATVDASPPASLDPSPRATPTGTAPMPTPTETPTGSATAAPTAAVTPRSAAEPSPAPSPRPTAPTLRIPGIGLQAPLHAEGLRGGKINPPAASVMWFTGYGRVAPGQVGTSVIAGHVAVRGRPDAFANLARVSVGDPIEIVRPDGTAARFRVVRAGVVDKDDLTTDQSVWGGNSSVRRLAIITCDDAHGFRRDGHRVANYVVIAEPA